MRRLSLAICAVVAATAAMLSLSACSSTVNAAPAEHTIQVCASSEVKSVPDTARIGVSVHTQEKTAEAAQTKNAESVNAVMAALKDAGVAEKSIQTSYADLSPVYDYDYDFDSDAEGESDESDEPGVRGYEMNTRLAVGDLAIDDVGGIMQACVLAGATGTDGPEFYAADYDACYEEALVAAMGAARKKADVLAEAAGAKVVSVASVEEGYQDTSYREAGAAKALALESASDAMDVAAGEVAITANVNVTYVIS